MSGNLRGIWEDRHRQQGIGAPEPFVAETMDLLPCGLVLDVAAGTGRHAMLLARNGFTVHAIDFSAPAMVQLAAAARAEGLSVRAMVADLDVYPLRTAHYDAVINTCFLNRALVPALIGALKVGGALLFDTFLIDQAEIGHPRNPAFLLGHYELRELMRDLEIVRYREGLTVYPGGKRAWRAAALGFKR